MTPETREEVRQVLMAARDLISDPAKWCGDGPGEDGTFCTHLALSSAAAGLRLDRWAAAQVLYQFVPVGRARTLAGVNLDDVYAWNDSPNTTHEEVVEGFDCAIASLEPAEKVAAGDQELVEMLAADQPDTPRSVSPLEWHAKPCETRRRHQAQPIQIGAKA